MIQHQGVYLPDGERHLVEWMTKNGEIVDGRGTYQIKKLRAALEYCRSFRTAIDVGAHVGLWSMQLARRFDAMHAFEPVAAHRECLRHNLDQGEMVYFLHSCALGAEAAHVRMEIAPSSSGDTRVGGEGDIRMRRLDEFQIEDVDFIKIDCEGYELNVLKGGEETIKRWMPVIIVEQKPGRGQRYGFRETEAVDWLRERGYRLAREMSGDFIMVPAVPE